MEELLPDLTQYVHNNISPEEKRKVGFSYLTTIDSYSWSQTHMNLE